MPVSSDSRTLPGATSHDRSNAVLWPCGDQSGLGERVDGAREQPRCDEHQHEPGELEEPGQSIRTPLASRSRVRPPGGRPSPPPGRPRGAPQPAGTRRGGDRGLQTLPEDGEERHERQREPGLSGRSRAPPATRGRPSSPGRGGASTRSCVGDTRHRDEGEHALHRLLCLERELGADHRERQRPRTRIARSRARRPTRSRRPFPRVTEGRR